MGSDSTWRIRGFSVVEFFQQVWVEAQKDDLFGKAAQLGFYLQLALFPALLFLTAFIGFLPMQSVMPEFLSYLRTVLPNDSVPLLEKYLRQIVSGSSKGILSFSLLGAFWAVSTGMAAVIDTLNAVYNVKDSRPLWKARGTAMVMTIGFTLFVILSMVLILSGGYMSQWIAKLIGYGPIFTTLWALVQWPLVIVFMLFAVSMVYYLAPNVNHGWRLITPGSVVAVSLWLISSLGFKYYVENFGTYNAAYGPLAGGMVLMLWLYLSGLVLLIGGEVDAIIESSYNSE